MSYLEVFWSPSREDNFTTASTQGKDSAKAANYQLARQRASAEDKPGPGLVPLKLFYSEQRKDNFTTATTIGEQSALAAGYRFVRIEGYVWPTPQPATTGLWALRLYWHAGRGDNFLTTCREDEEAAKAAGYRFVRIEAYAQPLVRFD
ncbi:hypothetical protein [Micropruina sp.]|uniref:hypothetical protein n=1 Tax=Micropruina sp. TaxID=2737536 RepID=UPI0039E5E60A